MQKTQKDIVNKALKYLPDNGNSIKNIYRELRVFWRRGRFKINSYLLKEDSPDPETIFWIDPNKIEYYTNYCASGDIEKFQRQAAERILHQNFRPQVFDRDNDKGKIYDGDWDVSNLKFSELQIYKAIDQRVNQKINWQDTPFYKTALTEIESGRHLWGCTNEEELKKRVAYIDELIQSIKTNGYQLNSDVHLADDDQDGISKHKKMSMEILVNIGRNGEYLFQDGRHRLSIAKVLNVDLVAVKVLVRHREWHQLRQMLNTMINSSGGASKKGLLYQSLLHPDLKDFPAAHDCDDRYKAIEPNIIGEHQGNLLDVGANFGYFCHKFEDLGYTCHAVELLKEIADANDKIRQGAGKKYQVINEDVLELFKNPYFRNMNLKIIIALNIFHHFLKTETKYNLFIEWLNNLNVDQMFFEAHKYQEPQMNNSYVNYTEEEFVKFIIDNTTLNHVKFIYQAGDGRKVYSLYR